jgi:hypothetical protein
VGSDLVREVDALLAHARERAVHDDAAADLDAARARLGEPLRVALVGRVKAGKSTLLNALVEHEVAPTDAGECTRVVTWYRHGPTLRAVVHPRSGPPRQRRFDRRDGAVQVDLGMPPEAVARVEVEVPSEGVRSAVLIDTPGLGSLNTEVSARTERMLHVDGSDPDSRARDADAVVYLLRHAHASDLGFLSAFADDELVSGTPLNTVGVLSRADEVGYARLDAMDVAREVADRYRSDDRLHRLCPVVVPVSGLVASAAASLREDEFRCLAQVATAPRDDVQALLLTADDFVDARSRVPVGALERRHLLDRLGLFGVRLSTHLVRSGAVQDGAELARELLARSGVTALREVLAVQLLSRASALKARSALATLDAVLDAGGCADVGAIRGRAEEVWASAHDLVEARMLRVLRSGRVRGRAERITELERLLGGSGADAAARLGLPATAGTEELLSAGYAALTRCRELTEHPMTSQDLRRAAVAAARSCERLLMALDA